MPIIESHASKEFRDKGETWTVLQDNLGRLFVSGDHLHVFDGQSWHSFSIPNSNILRAISFGSEGRIWAGAPNEIGYFDEPFLGVFSYHSLVDSLPLDQRQFGEVWNCTQVGAFTYFICRDRLLRWDGKEFQISSFAGKFRLFPLNVGGETWFHHFETGLYRLTESGAQLQIPASEIPYPGIMGIGKDSEGLALFANAGIFRPGNPVHFLSDDHLNQQMTSGVVSSFAVLPDGSYAVGTLNSGIILIDKAFEAMRTLNASDGLPARSIYSMGPIEFGSVWCGTRLGFFGFDPANRETLFDSHRGLKGNLVQALVANSTNAYAASNEGLFELSTSESGHAIFEQIPQLTASYNHILPYRNGLLLSRFPGMDYFDGSTVETVVTVQGIEIRSARVSHFFQNIVYLVEDDGLARLMERSDKSFTRERFLELPANCRSLYEDPIGGLWIGTVTAGAFTYDISTKKLFPVFDPESRQRWSGPVDLIGNDQRILIFARGRVYAAGPIGQNLHQLAGIPEISPSHVALLTNGQDVFVTYDDRRGADTTTYGAGVLSFTDEGRAHWRELDIPSLNVIGPIRTLTFSEERGHPILWLGGTEGILRVDYNRIGTLQAPPAPIVKSFDLAPNEESVTAAEQFPFRDHHVRLMLFTGDYMRGKDWHFETRLGAGDRDWSPGTAQRSFEFTNLSDGDYRFEARAVNSAGMRGPAAHFDFQVLPPWYRTHWAYGSYVAALAGVAVGFARLRESQIRRRNLELETLVGVRTAELAKASAAKDEFIAGVSHEIRNPMNGVVGIAESLNTANLDPDSRRKFGLLRQCAIHLSSLLEDILDISKLEAGAIELEDKPFDLPDLVGSITAITATESEKYGVPVEVAVSPVIPRQLRGDARRIRQILLNFTSNAIKYSGRGRVRVTVWGRAKGADETDVTFAISDEGPGISLEEQKKLFTRFERGNDARQNRVPGTGLGLALCKGLADQMHGRIWLESEAGRGSCFYFSAPFATAESVVPNLAAEIPVATTDFCRALVVDDEEYNRIVLADLLQALGFTVLTAGTGIEALELASHQVFHLVSLDYDLPRMSGLEVARQIRQLPGPTAHALIVATTAFTSPEKRAQCRAAGMNAFLGKPVAMDRLREVLVSSPFSTATAPEVTPPAPMEPADCLANLRHLAEKKQRAFPSELALFLSELGSEMNQLTAALGKRDPAQAGHFAHLLCGRCGFVHQRELVRILQDIESAVIVGEWADAERGHRELTVQMSALHVTLASAVPVVQPA